MPRKRRRRITKRQQKLVKAVTSGKTFKEAAKIAGYSHPQGAHEAFTALKLRFSPILEAAGFSLDEIVKDNFQRMLKLRDAKVTKHFAHNGIVMDEREIADNAIRRLAVRDTNEYLGIIGAGRPADDAPNTGYVGPAQVTVQVVIADPRSAASIVAISADGAADHQQLGVDAPVDPDPRRSGSEPSL